MLVIVLIIGISLASFSLMGEKASRNDRDRKIAFEAAESALFDAELDIDNSQRSYLFSPNSVEGFALNCGRGDGKKKGIFIYVEDLALES